MKTRKGRRFNASPHIKRQGLQGVFTVFPVLPIPVLFGLDPELLIWVNGAVVFMLLTTKRFKIVARLLAYLDLAYVFILFWQIIFQHRMPPIWKFP